jgi:WD40 repeat protein
MNKSYIFTDQQNQSYCHSKSKKGYHLEILDENLESLNQSFMIQTDDYDCAVDLHLENIFLSKQKKIEHYNLKNGNLVSTISKAVYGSMIISPCGTFLLFKSNGGFYSYKSDTKDLDKLQLPVEGLDTGIELYNKVIIPGRKKGQIFTVYFESGKVEEKYLEEAPTTFYRLKKSSDNLYIICIGKDKSIYWLDCKTLKVTHITKLKKHIKTDHMGTGCFSGNGQLLCLTVSGTTKNYMIVLDTATKEFSHTLNEVCYDLPYEGFKVRSASTDKETYFFKALNLKTGNTTQEKLKGNS